MTTAVLICPGRGSYGPAELGYLRRHHGRSGLIARLDARCAAAGQERLTALDAAPRFVEARHGPGANVAPLIYACTLADAAALAPRIEVVAVTGNSMGWYSALAVAGALTPEVGLDLVAAMGALMDRLGTGGQLILPLADADWRPAPDRRAALLARAEGIAARAGHALALSIDLGGHLVFAGDDSGLAALAEAAAGLAPGPARRLPGHAAFHTDLVAPVAAAAQARFGPDAFAQPRRPLIDGRGAIWWPGATDPAALRAYTLGHQVTRPYDFAAAIRTAAREFAPDLFVLAGPGAGLGAAVAQALILAGWRGLTCRADFDLRQAAAPVLAALGRPDQRAPLTGTGA